ncbi:MAG: hypothetical protein B5766_08220 [Candidatus Lumbricidophila eiseniae]|uniref:Uncharacterized protein n=1 Tax=Candidatus Lumbricidiphila eiseniae TaxID=1969409 RepID=A0A2A6FQ28_9MICO|nr:MAG: hypothetical protein B5766_08220 [Candidatus Lumbricidophila eiseniae]
MNDPGDSRDIRDRLVRIETMLEAVIRRLDEQGTRHDDHEDRLRTIEARPTPITPDEFTRRVDEIIDRRHIITTRTLWTATTTAIGAGAALASLINWLTKL